MSSLWLTVEVPPGADIKNACIEAVSLAEKLNLTIWFDFNGVKCLARAGDSPSRLEAAWVKAMASKTEHKIASDRGK